MPEVGYTKRRHKWSEEEILAKAREWEQLFGEPPAATDWNPSDSRAAIRRSLHRASRWSQRVQRFETGEWPWTGSVSKVFGTWNGMIEKAGFEPRPARLSVLPPAPEGGVQAVVELADQAKRARGEKRRMLLLAVADAALALAETA